MGASKQSVLLLVFLPVGLLGCAKIPDQSQATRIDFIDIVSNIRCEAKEALEAYPMNSWIYKASIGYEFRFSSQIDNNIDFRFKGVWPFFIDNKRGDGTFTGDATGAGVTKRRLGRSVMRAAEKVLNLTYADCTDVHYQNSRRYPIKGRIGVADVIDRFFHTSNTRYLQYTDFVQTLEFQVTKGAGVRPILFLRPVSVFSRTFTNTLNLTGSRDDFHQVIITLQPPKTPPAEQIIKVELVGESRVRVDQAPAGESVPPPAARVPTPPTARRSVRPQSPRALNSEEQRGIENSLNREGTFINEREIRDQLSRDRLVP